MVAMVLDSYGCIISLHTDGCMQASICCVLFCLYSNRPVLFLTYYLSLSLVDETTTDIICIKCKKDNSDSPNEIVLCDMCGIGE